MDGVRVCERAHALVASACLDQLCLLSVGSNFSHCGLVTVLFSL